MGDVRPQTLGSSGLASKGGPEPAPFDIILSLWGGTVWQGHTAASHSAVRQGRRPVEGAMRISVSSWATTDDDVEKSLEAMSRIAAEVRGLGEQTARIIEDPPPPQPSP